MQNNGFIKYAKTDCSCIHVVDIFYNDYLEQVLSSGYLIFLAKRLEKYYIHERFQVNNYMYLLNIIQK